MANPNPKKPARSRKDCPNKSTQDFRRFALAVWQAYMEGSKPDKLGSFFPDLAQLDARDRVMMMLKLAKFIAPEMSSTNISVSDGTAEVSAIQLRLEQMCDEENN